MLDPHSQRNDPERHQLHVIASTIWDVFRQVDMDPPEVVVLKSPEEGRRLIANSPPVMSPAPTPVEHPDGSVYMEVEMCGIRFRWPATKYALQSGGYVWR